MDFLPNGHRRRATFHAVPGLHREFSFTFLPFRGTDAGEALAGCCVNGALDKGKQRSLLVERLVAWDFDRPMDEAALRDMDGPMAAKITNCVFGLIGPDVAEDLGE